MADVRRRGLAMRRSNSMSTSSIQAAKNFDLVSTVFSMERDVDSVIIVNSIYQTLNAAYAPSFQRAHEIMELMESKRNYKSFTKALQLCPKVVLWFTIPAIGILVYEGGDSFMHILLWALIVFLINKCYSFCRTQDRDKIKQEFAIRLDAMLHEKARELGEEAKKLQQIRKNAMQEFTKIHREMLKQKLATLKAAQEIQLKLRNERAINYEEIQNQRSRNDWNSLNITKEKLTNIEKKMRDRAAKCMKSSELAIANLEQNATKMFGSCSEQITNVDNKARSIIESLLGMADQSVRGSDGDKLEIPQKHDGASTREHIRRDVNKHLTVIDPMWEYELGRVDSETKAVVDEINKRTHESFIFKVIRWFFRKT